MKISQQMIDDLGKLCEKNVQITIKGFNDFGQEFTTTGRITRTDKGKPGVEDYAVYVEFGKEVPKNGKKKQSEYFAPFKFDYDGSWPGHSLIVDEILLPNGEVIFKNPDAEQYKEQALKNKQAEDEKNKKDGRDLDELDPVTEKLSEMIGKPIVLDNGSSGVFVSCAAASNDGSPILHIVQGPLAGSAFVGPTSKLYTESLDGELNLVEDNAKTREDFVKVSEIFKARKSKIEQAKNNEAAGPVSE